MVLQFQLRTWTRVETLTLRLTGFYFLLSMLLGIALMSTLSSSAFASSKAEGLQYLQNAEQYYKSHDYFKSARYAFAAMENDPSLKPQAYAWVTLGLVNAGLPNAASYFFIRTLQMKNKAAIRSVLSQTQSLLVVVGADLLRKYLIRHTEYSDYDLANRGTYLYALGKEAILSGDNPRAIGFLNGIGSGSAIWPFALHLRGTAHAIMGKNEEAISDFKACASHAFDITNFAGSNPLRQRQTEREADDLRSRCMAGEARTLYQMDDLVAADRSYDRLPKRSFVWPDILFEQAWNSFGRQEYNRTLGKLVSYKSPALNFMFNTEIDVLRAQSYLALCLYDDTNAVINEFNAKYAAVGIEVKSFVENNANNLPVFYDLGKQALRASLYSSNLFYRLINRFIRGPYFQNLVAAEKQISVEKNLISRFDSVQEGVNHNLGAGFPGFLEQVLNWRLRTVHFLGGAFVKNSLLDYHSALLSDFEKMSFIKLEMLKKAKDKLVYKQAASEKSTESRERGNIDPTRRDDQYKWSFNGEFWNDELGDYVFGLESRCQE
ncbi:MAG: hypothetical protein ABI041_02310 [Bdellovibrionia bacterium]